VSEPKPKVWRPPTRRAFIQMLAAAVVAVPVRDRVRDDAKPLWIGHC
jgi:hypothetical protein